VTCCDTTFTQAKKYLSHKCRDQSAHKKERRKLRQSIRQMLRNMRRSGDLPANSGDPAQEVTIHTDATSNQLLQSPATISPSVGLGFNQSIASLDAAMYFQSASAPADQDPSAYQSAPIYHDYSSVRTQTLQHALAQYETVQAPIYSATSPASLSVTGRGSVPNYHRIRCGQGELGNF
jgi:hypothetical protein